MYNKQINNKMTEQQKTKTFGIKLYQHEIDEFKRIVGEMNDGTTDRDAFLAFMDFYVNPPKKIQVDNPELIKKNQDLQDEIDELQEANKNLVAQVENLESKLKSLDDEKAKRPDNIFEVNVHPVAFHFLKQMADDLKVEPGYILVDLFVRDLQNPRANNLPYIVPSSEIRSKMKEYNDTHIKEGKEA